MIKLHSTAILLFCILKALSAQGDFYTIDKVQELKIVFGYSDWDYRLDTAKAGKENYILASYCTINGVRFDSVGVKYKGNSTYNPSRVKNPLHIKLDFIKDQDYNKVTSIKLGNNWADPSAVREALSYSILANYMDCSRANFSRVYINGSLMGLYTNVEAVNKKFCSDHFGSSDHNFVKGNPDRPSGSSTSNLKFISYDSTKYYTYYGMENGYGWWKLIALIDTLRSKPSAIPKMIDVDRSLWMHAYNNVMSNYDSYTGSFSQNYYLYEDDYGRFLPMIWDLNMAFGAFPGNNGTSVDKVPILYQSTNPDRPLISSLLSNATYKRMYIAHLKTIAEENFTNNLYETQAKELQKIVDTLVKNDPNSLSTYSAFQTSLTAAITGGGPGGASPGIVTLMKARLAYYNTTTEYNAIAPTIGNYSLYPSIPKVGDTVWIQVAISNSNSAFAGFRKNKYAPFDKRSFYDDGKHHDGIAGDGIYGSYIIPDTRKTQFYIYAENNNAGLFSPRRAEYEYHILEAQDPVADIQPGELVLNEFMSSNQNTVMDPSDGKYEDWLELYNNTNRSLDLGGLNLTDDLANIQKYEFPAGISIAPKNRLMIWLDEDSKTPTDIHANFKLSASGEMLILTRQDGVVLDSLSFGPIPTDQSMERCPDGTGKFSITSKPTYNLPDCGIVNINQTNSLADVQLIPNPAHHYVFVKMNDHVLKNIRIMNQLGEVIFETQNAMMDITTLPSGFYLVSIVDTMDQTATLKLLKQ